MGVTFEFDVEAVDRIRTDGPFAVLQPYFAYGVPSRVPSAGVPTSGRPRVVACQARFPKSIGNPF
jgi:hypothetical protein